MTNIATQETGIRALKSILNSDFMKEKLAEVVGKNSATFATSIVQIVSQNEMLSKAEPNSIIGAALTAATLNLPLNNSIGQAYIVPFNSRQKDGSNIVLAQFILGYKGLKQLATRSGKFKWMNDTDVRKGEIAFHDRLSGEYEFEFILEPELRDKVPVIGYVSYFELHNGFKSYLYMTVADLKKHGKKFSQSFKANKGLWNDDFDKMCRKTVSKLHLNRGEAPLSIDMQTGIQTDQAVVVYDKDAKEVKYLDNEPAEIDAEQERILGFISTIESQDDADVLSDRIPDNMRKTFNNKLKEKGLKLIE